MLLRVCSTGAHPSLLHLFRITVMVDLLYVIGRSPEQHLGPCRSFRGLDLLHEGSAGPTLGLTAPLRITARAPRRRVLGIKKDRRPTMRALEGVTLNLRAEVLGDEIIAVGPPHF